MQKLPCGALTSAEKSSDVERERGRERERERDLLGTVRRMSPLGGGEGGEWRSGRTWTEAGVAPTASLNGTV